MKILMIYSYANLLMVTQLHSQFQGGNLHWKFEIFIYSKTYLHMH